MTGPATPPRPKPDPYAFDYLQALRPNGKVHATTCDSPEGFGDRFTALMQRQGLTVVRQTPEELRQLRGNPYRSTPAVPVAVPAPTPVRLEKSRFPKVCPPAENEQTFFRKDLLNFSHRAAEIAIRIDARRQFAEHLVCGRELGANAQWFAQQYREAQERQAKWDARLEEERLGELAREARAARTAALPALGQRVRLPSGQEGTVIAFLTFKDWEKAALVRGARGEGLARPGHWVSVPLHVQARASPERAPAPTHMPSLFDLSPAPESL